jgi:hypothetical protein
MNNRYNDDYPTRDAIKAHLEDILKHKGITGSSFSTITLTVADGTAPMTVTSTTKVDNLNVDMVDGLHVTADQLLPTPTFDDELLLWDGTNWITTDIVTIDDVNEKLGFYGITPEIQQTIYGSRGGNVALANLLNALHVLGLITDATTET